MSNKVRAERILNLVNTYLGFNLNTDARDRQYVIPRQVLMYIFRGHPFNLTVTQIGEIFNRHHATVIHAQSRVKEASRLNDDVSLQCMDYVRIFREIIDNYFDKTTVEGKELITREMVQTKVGILEAKTSMQKAEIEKLELRIHLLAEENIKLKKELDSKDDFVYEGEKSPFIEIKKERQKDDYTVAGIRHF